MPCKAVESFVGAFCETYVSIWHGSETLPCAKSLV